MKTQTLLFMSIFLILAYIIVFYKIKEKYSNIFTDQAANIILESEKVTCKPIENALNGNLQNMPVAQNFRIIGVKDDENKCYIKKSDTIVGNNSCTYNTNLYDDKFSNVVESITEGTKEDSYLSDKVDIPVCYIDFKKNAPIDNIIDYASYLNSKDPDLQKVTGQLNKEISLNTNLNNTNSTLVTSLADTSAELARIQAEAPLLSSKIDTLNQTNSKLTGTIGEQNQTIDNLKNNLNQVKNNITFNPQNNSIKALDANGNITNKCIDVEGISQNNFARVHLWDCWGGANQKWRLDDKMRLISQNSGKCLDLNYGNTNAGTPLIQYDCHDDLNMKWIYDNKKRLRSVKDTTKCIDIPSANYANGNKLQIWNCHDGVNQKWTMG
jgi:hypothetical protein